ncbi:Transmembrane_domain-containing protein [Hexamita inflata]|uniref:Transmembrane domain-containing protein n=1 Tax=Hexamita inflata TaxID=28002 RepID=A0AA86UAB7_9EUKA|nr:Transmembrane domain-containing protein [Hexamita inflata]
MNIPSHVNDVKLRQAVSRLGKDGQIQQLIRIEKPRSLSLRKKLYNIQQEFYDSLTEFGDLSNSGFCFGCFRVFGLRAMLQGMGYYRDNDYYNMQIDKIKKQIKKSDMHPKAQFDAAILTLDSYTAAQHVIKRINGWFGGKVDGYRVHAKPAPAPDDIQYQNLEYPGIKYFLKQLLTFFIILLTSVLLFTLTCLARYYSKTLSYDTETYSDENIVYYSIFALSLAFDLILRPILYWATGFERHISYTSRERAWMMKLYIYSLLSKLTLFYSRTIMNYKQIRSLLFIFGFSTDWRTQYNSGGQDAVSFIWTVVFGYNFLDAFEFAFYWLVLRCVARTNADKVKAYKSLEERYASKYVCVLVVFTFVLSFGHVIPEICYEILIYFPIQYFVNRWVLLRVSSPPTKTTVIMTTCEHYLYFAVVFAGLSLTQSYYQIGQGFYWLVVLMPCLIIFILIVNAGVFDWLIIKVDKKFELPIMSTKTDLKMRKQSEKLMGDSTREEYQVFKQLVSDNQLADAQNNVHQKQMINVAYQVDNENSTLE